MLESRYDVIIAPPTASDSGTNSDRTAPCMMNDGMNTERMHKQRQQPRDGRLHVPLPHGAGHRRRVLHLRVDVLDLDRRLVDQDADRQRQAAQRHDVDRVARQVQDDDRPQERQRDVEHDDDHGPQVAQEQQDHQPGQPGAQGPLDADALDGAIDDRRLVELVGDLHVVGHGRLEPRQVLP